jgi:uncharacterized protein involved in exopolysaccharide biosynthesis
VPIEFTAYGLSYLIFRHLRAILATFALGVAATVAVVFLSPAKYQATESLVVNFSLSPSVAAPGLKSANDGGSSDHAQVIASYVQMLQSHKLAEQVVAEVGALNLYPLKLKGKIPSAEVQQAVNSSPRVIDSTAYRLQKDIKAIADPTSNVIHIQLTNSSTPMALAALNSLVNHFLDQQVQLGRDSHLPFLQQQAERYRQQVADAQAAIDKFQKANGVSAIDEERSYLFQQRATLEQALKAADVRLQEDQSRLNVQRQRLAETPAVNRLGSEELPLMEGKVQLQALLAEKRALTGVYKPESEKMRFLDQQIAKLQGLPTSDGVLNRTETNSVYASLQTAANETEADLRAVTNSRNLLSKQLISLEAKIASRTSLQGSSDALVRQYQLADQNYREYLQAVQEAQISNDLSRQRISTVEVMDPAHALPLPVAPNKPLILIGGFMSSLMLALAVAYCLEIFDERVNSPRQVELLLGTPVLGSLEDFPLRRLPMKRIVGRGEPISTLLVLLVLAATLAGGGRGWAAPPSPSLMPVQPPPGVKLLNKSCPYGYGAYRPVGGPSGRQIICVPQVGRNRFVGQVDYGSGALAAAHCKTDDGFYACGIGASQCCAADRNNPCVPGGYACTAGVEVAGQAKHACCISR